MKSIAKAKNSWKFSIQNQDIVIDGSKIAKRPFDRIGVKSMTLNIGLKVKEPKRKCTDRNCPFHGNLSVRGKLFDGKVTGSKAKQTITLQKEAPILL